MKALAALLGSIALAHAAPTSAPQGGEVVFPSSGIESFALVSPGPESAKAEIIDLDSAPVRRAWRMETLKQPADAWKFQLRGKTIAPVKRGDTLWARFFLRSSKSRNETGEGHVTFVFETADAKHVKSIDLTVSAGNEWREVYFPFTSRSDLAAGEAQISLRAGFRPQLIEIGGVEVFNFGSRLRPAELPRTRVDYPGREENAPWRAEAERRIERIRKNDFTLHLVDSKGAPVPDAGVSLKLRRHAFGFGSAIDGSVLLGKGADSERYRDVIDRSFSRVVFENELKWQAWETASAKRRALSMEAIEWLQKRDIAIRGHVLLWPSWQYLPDSVRKLRGQPNPLRRIALERVRGMISLTRGRFHDWDVVNEPYAHHDLMDALGEGVMTDWFKAAHEADPDVRLFLNDYAGLAAGGLNTPHKDHFEKTARMLLQQGAPIHGIGLQCHFGWSVTPPEAALAELDRWGKLGLEVHLTEFDIDTTDEELQADYTRDLLTLAFSHPSVTAVMTWGFWEGRHWRPDAALWKKDWTLKPNGRVWLDLTTRRWSTEANGVSAKDGTFKFRGFPGDYEVRLGSGSSLPVRFDSHKPDQSLTIP